MLHLFLGSTDGRRGSDDFRLREAYRALRAKLDSDGMLETNTTELSARGLAPDVLVQHVSTIPFLSSARLVVVEGLCVAAGSGRGVTDTWQPLLDTLTTLPETNHLVLIEVPATREQRMALGRLPLLRALRELPNATVREFAELQLRGQNGNEVAAWVRERAAARGHNIEPAAAEELSQLLGSDLWSISSELDKLAMYARGRAITKADVEALTSEAREADIFTLVDAVTEGRAAPALRLAEQMLRSGPESPLRIQAMIARQLRHLVRAAELLERGQGEAAIGEATGVRHSYPLKKLIRQARAAGRPAVEEALRAVERADHAVKTGLIRSDRLALELLICDLAALAPRGGRAPQGQPSRGSSSRRGSGRAARA